MVQFRDEEIALFFGVLAVGDVHEGGHRPTRIALGIAQGSGVAEEIARRTILEPGFRPAPRASWSRPTWANRALIVALEQFKCDARLLVLDQARWSANPLAVLWSETGVAS
jgi:hypothetical protein